MAKQAKQRSGDAGPDVIQPTPLREVSWAPSSWRDKPVAQLPDYPDLKALKSVEETLSTYPALVFEGEVDRLRKRLADVAEGRAFLLQGGDCAESFTDFSAETIRNNFKILLQMSIVLTFMTKKPVVKVGRMAGQFAKPRSKGHEERDGLVLPSYRGDIINGHIFDAEARTPDPRRMERAYSQSAATLNLLRSLSQGGFADLRKVHSWNSDFVKKSSQNASFEEVAHRLNETLEFMQAVGMGGSEASTIQEIEFYTSHEGLLLHYEEALTQKDEVRGGYYSGSAHMLWIGDRTRQLDGSHVEFMRGINNPIGLKCGPTLNPDELLQLIDVLNPNNEPGRLTLITRMGHDKVEKFLPQLVRTVQSEGRNVVWCCDPMHGNTYTTSNGYKTRSFAHVLHEVQSFFDVHHSEGSYPGGVHFELTGKDVIECVGGHQSIDETHLGSGMYETLCDPRLNASQALELAFQLCGSQAMGFDRK